MYKFAIKQVLISILFAGVFAVVNNRQNVNNIHSTVGEDHSNIKSVVNKGMGRSVLMYIPLIVHSPMNPFVAIAKGLAKKGHFVTMVVPKLVEELTLFEKGSLIRQIVVPSDYNVSEGMERPSISNHEKAKWFRQCLNVVRNIRTHIVETHRRAFAHVHMKTLLESKDRQRLFDVVIVQALFNEVGYSIAQHFNAPLILMMGVHVNSFLSTQLGYFDNPAFVTSTISMNGQEDAPDFLTRLVTFLFQYFLPTLRWYLFVSQQETLLETLNITTDGPVDLLSLEREADFGFYSTHYVLDSVRPTLPNTIDVGFIHCRPPKPLTVELKSVFEQSTTPIIFVSFGSLITVEMLHQDIITAFKQTFSKLPYQIVIKSNKHNFDMTNVSTCNWCPQQDILGHPRTALFISQVGAYSVQEAIYHKVPIVAIPIALDQFSNSEWVERQGIGKRWRVNTHRDAREMADDLYRIIVDIVEHNTSYKANIDRVHRVVTGGQINTPLERALFWTEYVMTNQGAPYLKSPSRHTPFFKLLYFDIYAFLVCVAFLCLFATYKCLLRIKGKVVLKLRTFGRDGMKKD